MNRTFITLLQRFAPNFEIAKADMSLKKFLDAGRMVMGSPFDKKVKPLGSMSEAAQKRQGYTDKNGYWTERGFDRATSQDYQALEKSRKAHIKTSK